MQPIQINARQGKVKLSDVTKLNIDTLLKQIATLFGATASANGADFGELTAHAENAVDVLEIEIHSPGGSVFDGLKCYHELLALRARGVRVVAHINSLAASMGSAIAMGADEVTAVPHAKIMIHEVSSSAGGTAADHERSAKLCEELTNDLAGMYAKKTSQPMAKIRELMKAETWLNATEAKALRFVDRVIIAPNKTATAPTASKPVIHRAVTKPTTAALPHIPGQITAAEFKAQHVKPTMARTEWDKLTPSEKSTFIKSGGTLFDAPKSAKR